MRTVQRMTSSLDRTQVEQLVERITKEVMIALNTQSASRQSGPAMCGDCTGQCAVECAKAQNIIYAGSARPALSIGLKKDPSADARLIFYPLLMTETTDAASEQSSY